MIILLEALKRLKKRIEVTFWIMIISCLALIGLSVVGTMIDQSNKISADTISSSTVFISIGQLILILLIPIFLASFLRYIYLSYYHLEVTLLQSTKFCPEFFIISLITPVINLLYPYKFLKDLWNRYSYGISTKKNKTLIISLIIFNIIFITNILFGIINILKSLESAFINSIFIFYLFMVCIFGGLGTKYINDLFLIQRNRMESLYSFNQEKET